MTARRTVTIAHVGRIEGHGGIALHLEGGAVAGVDMDIHEGSRYYEALLLGRGFLEVQGIITRICAICSADHTVAALQALESALAIPRSRRTDRLRGLMLRGAVLESHALHLFALALPDFLGYPSMMAMAEDYPSEVEFALRLKQLGNRIQEAVGGRAVHPVNTLVGGFGALPPHRHLAAIRDDLTAALEPTMGMVEFLRAVEVPEWAAQPTVFVALRSADGRYRFRGDRLCTSRGDTFAVDDYRRVVREFSVKHSHAKHASLASGDSYTVGSLARLALAGDALSGRAREAFTALLPNGATDNIVLNSPAQLVEIVASLESGIAICEALLGMDETDRELAEYEVRAGRGIGAIEAPRGTLIHEYELDDDGRVVAANVITPTSQNLARAERDLRHVADRLLATSGVSDQKLKADLEMVVRAYDPCISCSVHVVRNAAPRRGLAGRPSTRRPDKGSRLLIVGLGNPLMGDDGAGAAVVAELRRRGVPPGVRLEVAPDVLHLASVWRNEAEVWLVDAARVCGEPGSVHLFEHDEILHLDGAHGSVHELSLPEGLRWLLNGRPDLAAVRFRLWGIEPEVVRPQLGLAPGVAAAVAKTAHRLSTEAERLLAAGVPSPRS